MVPQAKVGVVSGRCQLCCDVLYSGGLTSPAVSSM